MVTSRLQGAALSELVAGYLVGYPPEAREHMLQLLVGTARDLTQLNAIELRGEGEHRH